MSTARRITVTLTDTQYEALGTAVAHLDTELAQDGLDAQDRGTQRALQAGWSRINIAWHDKRRGAQRHE